MSYLNGVPVQSAPQTYCYNNSIGHYSLARESGKTSASHLLPILNDAGTLAPGTSLHQGIPQTRKAARRSYEKLCPRGENQTTVRIYETCESVFIKLTRRHHAKPPLLEG